MINADNDKPLSEPTDVLKVEAPPSTRRFIRLFAATIAIVAILLTVGQIVTQVVLRDLVNMIEIIRSSAWQRHQSQQLTRQALQLTQSSTKADYDSNLIEFRKIYNQFLETHLNARQGTLPHSDISVEYSDSVNMRYRSLVPYFSALQKNALSLIHKAEQAPEPKSLNPEPELSALTQYDGPFLQKVDEVIQQSNRENARRMATLKQLNLYLYVFTLLVLALVGWFIIRPAILRLQQAIRQLIEAETTTAMANRKLLSLNRTLKETRQQLFDATRQQYQQQMDEQKLRTSYLLAGQEEERKRLSRDLHDGIGQMLTAIKLQIESLETSLNGPNKKAQNIGTLKALVTQTIQEARNVSNNLMPTVLSDFGLIPALEMLADTNAQDSPIEVIFHTTLNDIRFEKNLEIVLYRISQEAVSNAIRHAKPHQITIELFEKDNYLHLIVCDDGIGFRVQRSSKPQSGRQSQGIHNMQERATLINAKFKLTSAPDKGTRVQVSIPFKLAYLEHEYNQTDAGR
ncbi:ATP-binding protein [Tellurirhabdus bombi]|uniref:ATP-binding protein n=1 Tax=Tellurirhabdus bombi TaxID=2907205 RepID=UPI001F492616|nr:sensor histidine kinase [Tellurirhabdus bombi]